MYAESGVRSVVIVSYNQFGLSRVCSGRNALGEVLSADEGQSVCQLVYLYCFVLLTPVAPHHEHPMTLQLDVCRIFSHESIDVGDRVL